MPASLNGTRAASTTLVKTRGDRDSPKGRALYWYGPGGKGNCSFVDVLGTTRGSVAEQNKKETKDSPPRPPPGEGVVRSPSPEEQDPKAPGRPSQGRRLPWRFTGLAGAGTGCAGLLRPAPRCGRSAGCCCGRARAEVEAAGGRPRRRADGGAAAGGGVETAADRRGRM